MKTSKVKVKYCPEKFNRHDEKTAADSGKNPVTSVSVVFSVSMSTRDYAKIGFRTTHFKVPGSKRTLCGRLPRKDLKPCIWLTCKKCQAIAEKKAERTP
jgi:hypothetical protein